MQRSSDHLSSCVVQTNQYLGKDCVDELLLRDDTGKGGKMSQESHTDVKLLRLKEVEEEREYVSTKRSSIVGRVRKN